ncbi:MAG: Trp biosynthesis-associated membrane protein [Actinomycetales bacterium]
MTARPAATARSPRRERLVVLGLGVLGAAVALLAGTRTWLAVTVQDPLAGSGRLHPDGRSVAALVPAAALVALAASVAAVTLRRVGRQLAALLLVAAGGAIGSATVRVLVDPRGAAEEALRRATGRTGDVSATTHVSGLWPWVALVSAALVVLAGATTIVRGRGWSGLSDRYDAPTSVPAGETASATVEESDDAWDALSRGEDPTR